jgi:hypothetical protein
MAQNFIHVFYCLNEHDLYNDLTQKETQFMKIVMTAVCFVLLSFPVLAETITFRDGHTVVGKILSQDGTQVKVDLKGLTMTYYIEEIKDIDGKPMASATNTTVLPDAAQIAVPTAGLPVPSVDNPVEKKALILKFIDVFGTRKAMIANFDAMMEETARQRPQEAQNIRNKFKIEEVIDRLIPLYDKEFTSTDLKSYIDFYSSAKGQKLISSIGAVTKGSVDIVSDYVKEKFPEADNQE